MTITAFIDTPQIEFPCNDYVALRSFGKGASNQNLVLPRNLPLPDHLANCPADVLTDAKHDNIPTCRRNTKAIRLAQHRREGLVVSNSCFFLAADGGYFPYACLAARRILDVSAATTPGFILYGGVSDDDIRVARRLLTDQVELVDVSSFMEEVRSSFRDSGIAAFIRLFADQLPQFEAYERIAYTDCDVLFNRDIGDLTGQALHAPLLAAHDDYMYFLPTYRQKLSMQPGAPYFNSGVLLFDMAAVRAQGLLERTRQVAMEKKLNDQNALNIAFEGNWQTMHPNWNLMSNYTREYRFAQAYARHFSGSKPWGGQVGVELDALAVYRDLAKDTPWLRRFQQRIPFERGVLKRLGRHIDAARGFLLNNERQRRRAHYDGRKTHVMYAEQADAGAMAVHFPEVLGGFG